MSRADQITLSVVALIGVGIGWVIPGCPRDPEPALPVVEKGRDQVQLMRISEGVDERGNAVRVSEYGLPTCERCRELFEEPEG